MYLKSKCMSSYKYYSLIYFNILLKGIRNNINVYKYKNNTFLIEI